MYSSYSQAGSGVYSVETGGILVSLGFSREWEWECTISSDSMDVWNGNDHQ